MTMHRLVSTMQQIARHEVEQQVSAALAVVQTLHAKSGGNNDYSCTVELRDSGVVLPRVPIATQLIGVTALPREHDLVLVVFAGGDLHAPVIVGRLYNEKVAPPKHEPGELVAMLPGGEKNAKKAIALKVSTPGDGTRSMKLTLAGESVNIELAIDDKGITFKSEKVSLTLKQSSSNDGVAELIAGDAKVTLKQNGDVSILAKGKLQIKAHEIEIKADKKVKVSGQTIELN
jgi:uncharacterized protein involved in type VI secretion and phage assembly